MGQRALPRVRETTNERDDMSDLSVAMMHARRLELHDHPAPPAGAEVHRGGTFHEVQRGDGAIAIAREYSQAFHMDVSAAQLKAANAAAFKDGLHPGEKLRVPGLDARLDAMFLAENTGLTRVGDQLVHTVKRGDTLSSIARRSNAANGTRVTWRQIYAENRATIGSNPDRVRVGQQLRIPGISTASAQATLQGVSELDQDVVLTRTLRVKHEMGGVETLDVVRFKANASHAQEFGTIEEAIWMGRKELQDDVARSNPMAIVQTRDGAFNLVPVRGEEVSENLDDSYRPLSLAYRAEDRGTVAVLEERWDTGEVAVRRFDR